jgi:hypothetical protein
MNPATGLKTTPRHIKAGAYNDATQIDLAFIF